MKRILAIMLALVLALARCACGETKTTTNDSVGNDGTTTNDFASNDGTGDTASGTAGGSAEDAGQTAGGADKVYSIGICQLIQHPALDAASQGFMDVLTAKLGEGNVKFDYQNASGESVNCATIVNGFVADDVDLILGNATAALASAASATSTIPILGTAITDYGTALSVDNWTGSSGTNISGTCDLAPLDQQAAMLNEWFPDAKTVGLLYCSAEPNSEYQCNVIEGYLKDYGYEVKRYSFTDSNDVPGVTQTACDNCDVLYIPTDNTAANNTEAIANIVLPAKVPVIASEEGICSGCGVATLSISYYELGEITGEMAYRILVEGADVSTMNVEFAPSVTKMYNAANCEALGLTVPDGYEVIE